MSVLRINNYIFVNYNIFRPCQALFHISGFSKIKYESAKHVHPQHPIN